MIGADTSFPFCVGAHGWAARICQQWVWSPSGSWLPKMETPECPGNNLLFGLQLLIYVRLETVLLVNSVCLTFR